VPNLKTFSKRGWLPDVNVLFALSASQHIGFKLATEWFQSLAGSRFFLCPITEAGLVRLVASPQVGGQSLTRALEFLRAVRALDNCAHLPVMDSWLDLIEPVAARLQGHNQVTDALLLGLAIRNDLVLVTLDRGFEMMAGEQFKANVLTLL
jgi:toxin-antitoxin system PIN domain toxin